MPSCPPGKPGVHMTRAESHGTLSCAAQRATARAFETIEEGIMKKSTTVAVAAVAVSVALLSATVFAQGRRPTPDQQAVMFRQGLMTVMGGVETPLGLMVRGRVSYDAARVTKAARELAVL